MTVIIAQRSRSIALTDEAFSALLSSASVGVATLLDIEHRSDDRDTAVLDRLYHARAAVEAMEAWQDAKPVSLQAAE